jgi:hypothetical protein
MIKKISLKSLIGRNDTDQNEMRVWLDDNTLTPIILIFPQEGLSNGSI